MVAKGLKDVEKRMKGLRRRLVLALEDPASHDPVYKVCQRVFHKNDDLALKRENPLRRAIRRRAFRRFLHGCPPRKSNDTSIGDALNWEWMVHCATKRKAGLVIVSRDADYGATVDGKSYINDHLRQEFSDRVSQKRNLLLYTSLSQALRHFKVDVSPQEEAAEKEVTSFSSTRVPLSSLLGTPQAKYLGQISTSYAGKSSWIEALTAIGLGSDDKVMGAAAAADAKGILVPPEE